jgi:hemerythrin-like domain-containing protein
MKITEALLAEHVVFHSVFDHIERVAPHLGTLAEIKVLASTLAALLEHHGEAEDKLLMEPLEHHLDHLGHRDSFHHEHEVIDGFLIQLQNMPDLASARSLLLKTVQISRHHFDKEERLIFPMAEQNLSQKTLQDLGQQWEKQRQVASA